MSYSNSPGPIPPRWLNCPRKSAKLIGDKFLAFKTPLSNKFNDQVPPENLFTPSLLISSMKNYKVNIGLWIDLTNTNRFYDQSEVQDAGIKYLKLNCKGHGLCPSEEQVKTFVGICKSFIRKNPLDLIAVHCTHGFNRTGFMIISYLVLEEEWSCAKALLEFQKARQPGIYKQDYIFELFSRYDEADLAPQAPPRPDWCQGSDDEDVDDNRNGGPSHQGRRSRRKEKFIKDPKFMEGVPGVTTVTDPCKVSAIQKRIQQMCAWDGTGFPGSQPVSMNLQNMQLLGQKSYRISWKADGTRYMMLIDGKDEIYFADRNNSIFKATGMHFPHKLDLSKHICDTLLDGEMVLDQHEGKSHPRYLAYDAVRIHGKDIMNDNFDMRFQRIVTDLIAPRDYANNKGMINKSAEPFSIRRKDFWDVNYQTTSKLLSTKFKQGLTHEPDGLIFHPLPEPYVVGTAPEVLKWKPPSHNSVDFKLKVTRRTGEGMLPQTVGELYVGGLDTPFDQMKVTKSLKVYDGKIIECRYESHKWVFMRERTDKSFPNAYKTALAVCDSIKNPVTEEILLNFISTIDKSLMPPPSKRSRHF